ncbi:MAG: aspartate-semialdehyde dehydrogenase [Candidatus Dormibacteria bacterium]
MQRFRVGVLGATGAVGQYLVGLLAEHPWFVLTELVASDRSAGRPYAQAVRWRMPTAIPEAARDLTVKDLQSELDCDLLLSALDTGVAEVAEEPFARAGFPVISNSRNHRMDPDVPLVIPEVNPGHLDAISSQRRGRGWERGLLLTNPNCSTIGLAMALKPLQDRFGLAAVQVTTMQAISGAGLDGISAAAIHDNVIPHIAGEEEKLEAEPKKILGSFDGAAFRSAEIAISAHCNRVPVLDGHMESISVSLRSEANSQEVADAFREFRADQLVRDLPSAPIHPILLTADEFRPQPRLDRGVAAGMSVVVGRVRPCAVLDWKFTALVHNMVRGAAGAAILNAELLVAGGWLDTV